MMSEARQYISCDHGLFDLSSISLTTVAEKWHQWKQMMQLFIKLKIGDKSEQQKCSAFCIQLDKLVVMCIVQ